ncbi:MAG: glycosyltransferase family 39 protein [Candidatus Moranbacteria bacterium]|nr:glycosyltransferase family 39 protein [Candidatus Moranbacteria bacterium]
MNLSYKNLLLRINSAMLLISAVIIFVHKTPSFYKLHFVSSTIPYHIIFLISFSIFFLLLLFKKISLKDFFILSAPTEIALIYGTYVCDDLHYLFSLFVGLWIIAFGTYLISERHKKINSTMPEKKSRKNKSFSAIALFFILATCIIHFLFGINNLKNETYTDERLWTYGSSNRIEKFWKNVATRDWINTRPSDKPGVTLAIISGAGLIWEKPSDFFHNISDNDALLQMLFIMRLPLLIFGTLMIPVFYWVLQKIYEPKIALISTILIGTSPILLGMSRIINPDALIFIFMPLSLFSYLAYTKKDEQKWLYITGIFLGLSLLTKYISNLLFIFFFISIFTQLLFASKSLNKKEFHSFMARKVVDFLIIIFVSISTFYLLFPGVWLKADRLLIATIWSEAFLPVWKYFATVLFLIIFDLAAFRSQATFWLFSNIQKFKKIILLSVPSLFLFSIFFVVANTYTHMPIFNLEDVLTSPKSFTKTFNVDTLAVFFSGFYALIFAVSPLIFLGALLGIVNSIKDIIKEKITFSTLATWHLLLFVIVYYLGSTFSLVGPIIRYQIIVYPLFYAIAGIGIWMLLKKIFTRSKSKILTKYAPFTLVFLLQFFVLWRVMPFFFSYNSPLLPNEYIVNPKDMGDGNYKTAEFLNSLPNAKKLSIWSDNNGICTLFIGSCSNTNKVSDFSKKPHFDYYVISRGRQSRMTSSILEKVSANPNYFLRLDRLYESPDFIFELTPGDRENNFIRVIPSERVNIYAK